MNSMRDHDARLTVLTPYDCWNLLDRPRIGRVVWSRESGPPGVVPVNVSVYEGSLWFRSSPTTALVREATGEPIAVQIDELDPLNHSGWSVIVEGTAEVVPDSEVPDLAGTLEVWPAGDQSVYVRVEPERISGRKLLRAHRSG